MKNGTMKTIYRENGILLGETDGKYYLIIGENTYRLDDLRYEPCLYIKGSDRMMLTIHHAFTVEELCRAAQTDSSIKMVTGNDYNISGVLKLIRKAIELSMESVDLSYVEGHCFMDYMREHGALSPETAVAPADAGMKNAPMYSFIHSKKVCRTSDGLFYLRDQSEDAKPDREDRFFRVISDQVRFGCGYRNYEGRRQYFVWHGYPSRNDDFFTTVEISKAEYLQIGAEYPVGISADRETAEVFRNKYISGHPVILEGWNKLL